MGRMDKNLIRRVRSLLPRFLSRRLPVNIVVVKITRGLSRRLNRIYLGKKNPTNVLSFRYAPDYGEILICSEAIRREAKKQGNSYKYQVTWMILHGMLHLAGIHHEGSKKAAERAARIEHSILNRIAGKKAQSPDVHRTQIKQRPLKTQSPNTF